MKESALLIIIILCIASCANENGQERNISARITAIENGLLEFRSPSAMFEPDSAQLSNPYKISDRMEHYNVPGLSLAVIRSNNLDWIRDYGVADAKTKKPVTSETIFEAASASKIVTAAIALYYVQKGIIDLDRDVNEYLKSWKVPDNEFTTVQKVTLRRLLTHQAGMPETNYSHVEGESYPTLIDVLNGTSPALNMPATPELVPGTKWQYSNIGYNVIELIIEDISGRSFEQNAQEIIFKPLKMTSSSFSYPLDDKKAPYEAMPHDSEGNSLKPIMHRSALGHGGLTTTNSDMARFIAELLQAYHGDSDKILSQQTVKQMISKEVDLDPAMFGIPLSQGLGGVLTTIVRGDLVFLLPGSNLPGLNCWNIAWPSRGDGAVVMTNGALGELLSMEIIASLAHSMAGPGHDVAD